jgi:hypothetical protein
VWIVQHQIKSIDEHEFLLGNVVEGGVHDLFEGTILPFVWGGGGGGKKMFNRAMFLNG